MKSLDGLSDNDLLFQLRRLVKKEQDITINILAHLAEVRRRELYLARAYNSLYEYCRGELDYTDASAWRRANAAESIAKCPEALDLLKAGRVNLSTLAVVSRIITPEILQKICGKSKTEVELLVAAWDPKRAIPDRTRPVMVPRLVNDKAHVAPSGRRRLLTSAGARQAPDNNAGSVLAGPLRSEVTGSEKDAERLLRSEVELEEQTINRAPQHTIREVPRSVTSTGERLEFEQKWRFEGVVSTAVKEKLDRCKFVVIGQVPGRRRLRHTPGRIDRAVSGPGRPQSPRGAPEAARAETESTTIHEGDKRDERRPWG